MSFEIDDEILQDFLVEAGELLEQLGEQLVELEQIPDDPDLLNAIFRNFHTIKGGAGFLNITHLVNICHKAEDVFNALRQGEKQVDSEMMDTFLQVLDVVNEMFEDVKAGNDPVAAETELLETLQAYLEPAQEAAEVIEPEPAPESDSVVAASPAEETASSGNAPDQNGVPRAESSEPEDESAGSSSADLISEDEFEDLLDQLHGAGKGPTTGEQPGADTAGSSAVHGPAPSAGDLITEDEFEELLDQLHGKGRHGQIPDATETTKAEADAEANEARGSNEEAGTADDRDPAEPVQSSGDLIQEDEFEALLDELHGKGKHVGKPADQKVEPAAATPKAKEPEKPQPPVATTPVIKATTASPPPKPEIRKKATKKAAKPNAAPAETTVRVDVQRLDEIMNMVGELVLVRNRLENLKTSFDREQIGKSISNLDVVTSDLQRAVMKTRMQPIKKVFGRFPRVVRDLARSLNKEIRLELRGEETDLDKNLVEALADPLVHLVRNAVDHGVETPDERELAGKSREGTVILTASQEGDHIQLMIEDDGKGMNADRLRRVVVEKGLMDEESAARLDDRECFNLIFMPGFSTKSEISDVSGRGVGMDVVKTRINQMNGSVAIDSIEGKGSKIIIKVPLTLAIMPTLMVKLNEQPFALPLVSVVEILDLDLNRTNVVDGQLVVMVRDHALPLFYLKDWLVHGGYRSGEREIEGHVVVVNVGGRHVGFVVDHLIGQEEVVIKALGAKLQGLDGLSGATITGDGNIALILDVPSLMNKYAA